MKKLIPILILIMFFNGIVTSQTYTYSGKLLDKNSKQFIEYGHIYLKGKPHGTLSNIEGEFSLSNITENDTLIISCVGYEPLKFKYQKQIQKNILLSPRTYNLKPTEIKSGKSQILKAGFRLSKIEKNRIAGAYHALISDGQNFNNTGAQTGIFIENSGKQVGLIQNVEFFLHKKGIANTPFRLRLYSVNDKGKPGRDLMNKNLIVTHGRNNDWVKIDLRDYQIEFPENGFFIAMEWLQTNNETFTYKSKRRKFLNKSGRAKQKKESNWKLDFLGFGQVLGYYELNEKEGWSWSKSIIQEWSNHQNSSVPMIRSEIKVWE